MNTTLFRRIPSSELDSFNKALVEQIHVEDAYFGKKFTGHVPENYGLKGKDATAQFAALQKSWDYSTFDVVCEVSANRKAVFLNYLFWASHDFSDSGIAKPGQEAFVNKVKEVWEFNHIEVPLPSRP